MRSRRPDHLKEGLLEFLQQGEKNLDECVIEGAEILERMGFNSASNSDSFRLRVFDKLSRLIDSGHVTRDRSVKPPLFAAAKDSRGVA